MNKDKLLVGPVLMVDKESVIQTIRQTDNHKNKERDRKTD